MMKGRSPQTFDGWFSGRIARVIVVLFLTYAGVDIANPQLCSEEFGQGPSTLAATIKPGTLEGQSFGKQNSDESRNEQLPTEPHNDDDCFCCCTHVLPGLTNHPNGALDIVSQDRTLVSHVIASAYLTALEHPPRV